LEREVLSNSFLKEKNINVRDSKEISELVLAPSVSKTTDIPNKCSHLETTVEARAWRAGVFLKSLGARGEDTAAGFLVARFSLGIIGID
jgi:hypothetical protein